MHFFAMLVLFSLQQGSYVPCGMDQEGLRWWRERAMFVVTIKPGETAGHVAKEKFGNWKRVSVLCFLDLKKGCYYSSRDARDPMWATMPPGEYAVINCSYQAGP